jgi:hypothetical protein
MTAFRRESGSVYEVTVLGALGPVLRRAIEPCTTAPVECQTIVRACVAGCADLVELVQLLESGGLQIAEVAVFD